MGLCCGCWAQDRTSAVLLMVVGVEGGSGLMRLLVCVIIYGFRVRNKNKNTLFGAVCSEVG